MKEAALKALLKLSNQFYDETRQLSTDLSGDIIFCCCLYLKNLHFSLQYHYVPKQTGSLMARKTTLGNFAVFCVSKKKQSSFNCRQVNKNTIMQSDDNQRDRCRHQNKKHSCSGWKLQSKSKLELTCCNEMHKSKSRKLKRVAALLSS